MPAIFLPSSFGDDVAAEADLGAFDRRCGVAAFDPGLVGRAALDDLCDEHAFVDRQVERLGQVRGDRAAADAEVGVLDLAVRSRAGRRLRAAVLIGIAKPMPTLPLPPPPVSICELMPITSPSASISGPPELPGLIAASVWITCEIEKPLGAWIWRCRAETMPLVTVRSRPNGLPIATTGSPTSTSEESPRASGCSSSAGASTLSRATSVAGSVPTTFGRVGLVGGAELDRDLGRRLRPRGCW